MSLRAWFSALTDRISAVIDRVVSRIRTALAYYKIGRNVHKGVELEIRAGMDAGVIDSLTIAKARGEAALLKGGKRLNDDRWPSPDQLGRMVR